jgi:hypothetical protein
MAGIMKRIVALLALLLSLAWPLSAQSTTGSISGTVTDQQQAVLPNVIVTVRNVGTNVTRNVQTDGEGRYRVGNLSVGSYEVTFEAQGFAKVVRAGLTLVLNQNAVVDISMKPTTVTEVINVTENASLLNTTSAEVGVRFDTKRITDLPLATNRSIYNIVLSAPGVSQLGSGQQSFAGGGPGSTTGVSFSANGGRIRSNNFMIDGQDINDPSVTGGQQPLNNPDIIQEVRLITNQFAAEFGRSSGSVVSVVTKSGTNEYRGSLFWYHNDNHLNALNNQEKASGRRSAPFRLENQFGGTFGCSSANTLK